MRVILRADVADVGTKGEVIEVADGFGRNYLLPRGLAMKASPGAEAQAESMRRSRTVRDVAARGVAEEVAKTLVAATVTVPAKVGSAGRLFGSIGTAEIAGAISAQTGIEIDRRKLHLDEPIKATGTHLVPAKLHPDVEFPVTVEVVEG
jgi:large subunit ribosomal protein L9